jgi:hypothetical protein
MRKDGSLLLPESIAALRDNYYTLAVPELAIEFLGDMSYCARAINNSKNPKKAAATLLAKEKIQTTFDKWLYRKTHPNKKEVEVPEEIHDIIYKYRKLLPTPGEDFAAAAVATGDEE